MAELGVQSERQFVARALKIRNRHSGEPRATSCSHILTWSFLECPESIVYVEWLAPSSVLLDDSHPETASRNQRHLPPAGIYQTVPKAASFPPNERVEALRHWVMMSGRRAKRRRAVQPCTQSTQPTQQIVIGGSFGLRADAA